ncbi:[FeFe] hydrogenase H-cluster radical SAM maturase HydE [Maridesulfovibrio hydrothermalis]|uniref:Radical SAM domain protein n=1 Tax=Maridesulfovibrio hydrothermalis AM13 = DSM 14728 TaxID=1121451 RepID=L0RHI1_9BACT|nr:[FeFe] hydrogenase H-cluster radical SAM maturase HydE [Maridesulfovibrio hydrothermalis]CCO25031.1 Radical SAM domain protein [Maridesulfovibrio hydrothermalis AM13 = DSM 14728]
MYLLNAQEIEFYLNGGNDQELYTRADQVRQENFGDEVYLRAIVEFSNVCNKKCKYCGLRAPNSSINRYRLKKTEILDVAELAAVNGAKTIVLQSGDDFSYSSNMVGEIVREIKSRHDVAVTLSLGDRSAEEYAYWFECGADRTLIKLETTDSRIYNDIRCGESLKDRLKLVKALQETGYEVGSGIIVGLPGYSIQQLVADLLFLTDLELDMVAAGPFIPHPDTPYSDVETGNIDISYRFTALLRLLNPQTNIPATSALDSFDSKGRETGLRRGCNVIMPSVTPSANRADYNIYPGKNSVSVDVTDSITNAENLIRSLNFVPSVTKGSSKRKRNVK